MSVDEVIKLGSPEGYADPLDTSRVEKDWRWNGKELSVGLKDFYRNQARVDKWIREGGNLYGAI